MQTVYQYVLGRAGSSAEIAAWVNSYNLADSAVRDPVALAFLTSQEYHTDLLVAWLQQFQAGLSAQTILAAVLGSNEGYAKWS